MQSEARAPARKKTLIDRILGEDRRVNTVYRWVGIVSAIVLALATVGTAWSGYQSALWGGDRTAHAQRATTATIRAAHFAALEQKRLALHVNLFAQWVGATSAGNTALANFLLNRFPEPLKAATIAWQATRPLTNPDAPATPFDMPDYALAERAEAERWEATAFAELSAAAAANEISNRYLLFTVIFASALFFAGISGKFRWQVIDVAMLALGTLTLVVGLTILLTSPIK